MNTQDILENFYPICRNPWVSSSGVTPKTLFFFWPLTVDPICVWLQSGCAGEQAHRKPHSSQQPLHPGWTWEQLLSSTRPPNRGNWPRWDPGAPGNRDLPFLVLAPELCWFLGWESIHFCSWEQLVLSLATVWLVISSLLNKSWDKEPFTR